MLVMLKVEPEWIADLLCHGPQLTSWAGDCPGNNESAGKRKSSRVPKGNVYLKTALVEAANAPPFHRPRILIQ